MVSGSNIPKELRCRIEATLPLLSCRSKDQNQRYDDAIAALQAATKAAKTPQDTASVEALLAQAGLYKTSAAQARQAESQTGSANAATVVTDTRTMTITGSDGSKL